MRPLLRLCLAFAALAGVSSALADFLSISPAAVEISVPPGGSARGKFVVKNAKTKPISLLVEIQEGVQGHVASTAPLKTSDWLSVKTSRRMGVPPGGSRAVRYSIKVPPNFSGETVGYVFFSQRPDPQDEGSIGIRMRQGIPIYVAAKGTEKAVLSVVSASVTKRDDRGLNFLFIMGVEGNVHARPKGVILISNDAGRELERVPLDYGIPIFPGEPRNFAAKSGLVWNPGSYAVRLTSTFGESWGPQQTFVKEFRLVITAAEARLESVEALP